jgi:hypothetical protein
MSDQFHGSAGIAGAQQAFSPASRPNGGSDRRGSTMTVTTLRPHPAAPTDSFTAQAQGLRRRAESLRAQAEAVPAALATAYRRRASELELEAFLVGLQTDDGEVTGAPAA